jgi:hypothetical protein
MSNIVKTIDVILKDYIAIKKITCSDLAEVSAFSVKELQYICDGKLIPPNHKIIQLASLLNMSYKYICNSCLYTEYVQRVEANNGI